MMGRRAGSSGSTSSLTANTTVTASKKFVDVNDQYDTERLRPKYNSFSNKPLFLMGS